MGKGKHDQDTYYEKNFKFKKKTTFLHCGFGQSDISGHGCGMEWIHDFEASQVILSQEIPDLFRILVFNDIQFMQLRVSSMTGTGFGELSAHATSSAEEQERKRA